MADQGVRRKSNDKVDALVAALQAQLDAKKPAFSVYLTNSSNSVSNDTIPWDGVEWQRGGLSFDTGNNRMVVPVGGAGLWQFNLAITSGGTQTVGVVYLQVNGGRTRDFMEAVPFVVNREHHATIWVELQEGDVVEIFHLGAAFDFEGSNPSFYTRWQGRLVEAD